MIRIPSTSTGAGNGRRAKTRRRGGGWSAARTTFFSIGQWERKSKVRLYLDRKEKKKGSICEIKVPRHPQSDRMGERGKEDLLHAVIFFFSTIPALHFSKSLREILASRNRAMRRKGKEDAQFRLLLPIFLFVRHRREKPVRPLPKKKKKQPFRSP